MNLKMQYLVLVSSQVRIKWLFRAYKGKSDEWPPTTYLQVLIDPADMAIVFMPIGLRGPVSEPISQSPLAPLTDLEGLKIFYCDHL